MAIINNGLLRDTKGSLGNNYFRMQNGKLVICSKPHRYRPSMKKRPKAIRDMMKSLMAISKNLMKDAFFYDLWKIKEIKGLGPYHKFISKNHFGKKEELSFGELKLSPYDDVFNAEIDNFSITEGNVAITIKSLGTESGITTFREPLILSRGIVIASGLKDSKDKILIVEKIKTVPVPTDLINPINLNYALQDKHMWENYTDLTVLLILVTLNSEEKNVRTSVTLSCHKSLG